MPRNLGTIAYDESVPTKDYVNGRASVSSVPTQATISSTGLITFKNSEGTSLFTVQLPLYDGSVS